jgi:hypothetical protein
MFSFLSNWRQTISSSDGDSNDVSSLNRSLNLPLPVTESSPRKNKIEGTAIQQQQQPATGMNVRDISYPMPKKALKSYTRADDHPAADGLPGPSVPPTIGATDTPPLHPFIAAPAPSSESVPWFQESAARRKNNNYNLRTALLQANAYAQHASIPNANAPPEVVRLDSNDVPYPRPQRPPTVHHDGPDHHASYAAYTTHPYANGISDPNLYANYPYAHQMSHNEGDQNEIYASPFGHSDDGEDGFFRGLHPSRTRSITPTPTSRWGGLKLHTASPFSQSTLHVDGLNFPPPPDMLSHHQNLPTGIFPPSLRPGTPPLPTVQTDVYNHAYNYPLAKQLSPIEEQDYYSPISARVLPGSAASASPGADSVLNFGFGNGSERERMTAEGDKGDWERGSTRTRSGRTGSAGSVKAPAMTSASASGSGSLSMKEGASTNSNPSPSGPTIGFEATRAFSSSLACLFTS